MPATLPFGADALEPGLAASLATGLERVELRLRPWNRNYVGTHYGGNLFSMTDPFWMIMILRALGKDYFVWDQAAEIAYLKPGKGTVSAEFKLDDATLNGIRAAQGHFIGAVDVAPVFAELLDVVVSHTRSGFGSVLRTSEG